MRSVLAGQGAIFLALMISLCSASAVHSLELKGHKDRLFAYPGILSMAKDGSFMTVQYDKMRDIHKRDVEPERRVRSNYVSLAVKKQSRLAVHEANGRTIKTGVTGDYAHARFAVIFVHGRGGDQRLGMNDYTFGGNFNRLKNLVVLNGAAYLAPTVASFDDKGASDVKALILAGQAPVVLACASMGAIICSKLAHDREVVPRLAGMVLLGGVPDRGLAKSAAVMSGVPMSFTHGSLDTVYPWQDQKAVFDAVRGTAEAYPARFVLFDTGSHGTPMRMTDWKQTLEFLLSR
ncbi:alpha/beta hydrolase [Hoeflea sp. YIM 152468]|uniref:alpha/beta hydrolase n=1 Tax=Hoeflea sp. YIM 152468 TaxID=3031759 RepID=UPI0023DA6EC0|nr:alpha/beta hydrolase [Hoeflea sp. YIM 152468]MDF1609997.1 alpha/beta hydrolase [Hoeflea sp. YIM 152468]